MLLALFHEDCSRELCRGSPVASRYRRLPFWPLRAPLPFSAHLGWRNDMTCVFISVCVVFCVGLVLRVVVISEIQLVLSAGVPFLFVFTAIVLS